MLPGMKDCKPGGETGEGNCLSLNQWAEHLVCDPTHPIYHFLVTCLMKTSVQNTSEKAQSPFHFISRQDLFNDVICACLIGSPCCICPFHGPNHLPLWFFFFSSKLINRLRHHKKGGFGEQELFKMFHWMWAFLLQSWHSPWIVRSQCQSAKFPSQIGFSLHSHSRPIWSKETSLIVKTSLLT